VRFLLVALLILASCTAEPEQAPSAPPPTPTTPLPSGRDTVQTSAPDTSRATWTAGITDAERSVQEAVLQAVRTAAHPDFDRTVFEFEGGVPSYHVEYIDEPVRQCGSGNPVPLPGEGWLEIRFSRARAHTEAGASTLAERALSPDLPVLRALSLTCDFEGTVTWVLGLAAPNRYRVIDLSDPARLVVDVRT
jgi:hypothetical protein